MQETGPSFGISGTETGWYFCSKHGVADALDPLALLTSDTCLVSSPRYANSLLLRSSLLNLTSFGGSSTVGSSESAYRMRGNQIVDPVIDSGVTTHCCPDITLFETLDTRYAGTLGTTGKGTRIVGHLKKQKRKHKEKVSCIQF